MKTEMTPTQKEAMIRFHQRMITAATACGKSELVESAKKELAKLQVN
jgi:hypothetical protein